jgi:hypothetical protein
METTYKGIDYRCGTTNRDESGIRYGVISQHVVLQAWADSSEGYYPCNECQFEQGDDDCQDQCCDAVSYYVNNADYAAESDDYGDIFITRSPYYTFAQFCSPCAPGACHLGNPLTEPNPNNKCYCFGHDWFEDGRAPYTVYDVKTGAAVRVQES